MKHDFRYISKKDPQVFTAYNDLIKLLNEVRNELRGYYTFQHKFVGSYSRNMISYDTKSNVGFDFDVNIYPNDKELTAKEIKMRFKKALDKWGSRHGFDSAEDSTRVLTIKIKDRKHSRVVYSVDFAFVYDYTDDNGDQKQLYIHFNKKQNEYSWEHQPDGYYKLPEKIQWIKNNNLWQKMKELYIKKKNANNNPDVHSRTVFAVTVHEICQKNGYYDDYDEEEYDYE